MAFPPINYIVIFITGGSILALELISSRVLTPYFGVSLYIWAGILTITLVALSIGYRRGGKISELSFTDKSSKKIELQYRFLMFPAESSIALALVTAIYPYVFYDIARETLLWGSFIASTLILYIPLVCLSAMNPLLIAINELSDDGNHAGKSSGDVLFISTLGSVAGVLVTAFILIPNISNHNILLFICFILSLTPLISVFLFKEFRTEMKKRVIKLSCIGLVLCLSLLFFSDLMLSKDKDIHFGKQHWKIEKEYSSTFGNIKVVRVDDSFVYFQGENRQTQINLDGTSVAPYTYVLESLALGTKDKASTALVLGLAGGVVPMNLANQGLKVHVVDIVPESVTVAKEYFNFDEKLVEVSIADARTFVRDCNTKYDVGVVDISAGGILPEHLVTRGFFADLKSCIKPDGPILINSFLAGRVHMQEHLYLIKTLQSVFSNVKIYYNDTVAEETPVNLYIVASDVEDQHFNIDYSLFPENLMAELEIILKSPKKIDKELLSKAEVVTDNYNYHTFLNAKPHLVFHKAVFSSTPPLLLVN